MDKDCHTCLYGAFLGNQEPCKSCYVMDDMMFSNWQSGYIDSELALKDDADHKKNRPG